jgi:hypothetical protein
MVVIDMISYMKVVRQIMPLLIGVHQQMICKYHLLMEALSSGLDNCIMIPDYQ